MLIDAELNALEKDDTVHTEVVITASVLESGGFTGAALDFFGGGLVVQAGVIVEDSEGIGGIS